VHRDLKPENLFITRGRGGVEHCKVLDFGIAKVQNATTFTRDGALLGTVQYMAPEQVLGHKALDGRVDVFALGAILYECLAGAPAFDGEKSEVILYRILHDKPAGLLSLNSELPSRLEHLVHRALDRDPGRRYQSVRALAEALSEFAGDPALDRQNGAAMIEALDIPADLGNSSNSGESGNSGNSGKIAPGLPTSGWLRLPRLAAALFAVASLALVALAWRGVATETRSASLPPTSVDVQKAASSERIDGLSLTPEAALGVEGATTVATVRQPAEADPRKPRRGVQMKPEEPGSSRPPSRPGDPPPQANPSGDDALELDPNPYR
jgi:serine/threonine-protein kinase